MICPEQRERVRIRPDTSSDPRNDPVLRFAEGACWGNAAGDGARLTLLNGVQRTEAERLACQVEHMQTGTSPSIQDEFVTALGILHARDPFPRLQDVIPASSAGGHHGGERKGAHNTSEKRRGARALLR